MNKVCQAMDMSTAYSQPSTVMEFGEVITAIAIIASLRMPVIPEKRIFFYQKKTRKRIFYGKKERNVKKNENAYIPAKNISRKIERTASSPSEPSAGRQMDVQDPTTENCLLTPA